MAPLFVASLAAAAAALTAALKKLRKIKVHAGECWTVFAKTNLPHACNSAAAEVVRHGLEELGNELEQFECDAAGLIVMTVRFHKDGEIAIGRVWIPHEILARFGVKGRARYYVESTRAEPCEPAPKQEPKNKLA